MPVCVIGPNVECGSPPWAAHTDLVIVFPPLFAGTAMRDGKVA